MQLPWVRLQIRDRPATGYAWHGVTIVFSLKGRRGLEQTIDRTLQKRIAADAAAALVTDGMVVGLGSGSTAALAVSALGQRVAEGLHILGVPTSEATAAQARLYKIPLTTLNLHPQLDVAIDGADEVEKGTLHLIKGHGGALLREKIVASASKNFVVIADESKLVDRLGTKFAVPVEVDQFGWIVTARKLEKLGCEVAIRKTAEGVEFVTDGNNYILDCVFGAITDPSGLARELDGVVGVVEHGLFPSMTSQVLLGGGAGVTVLER
ncbi:MAG: ribose-5-phosphate isomerase RpiA [Bryobacterales bacterium]|nr:ribose-5-phosphate isomerase RpiA [Bryobacterales bacterium]